MKLGEHYEIAMAAHIVDRLESTPGDAKVLGMLVNRYPTLLDARPVYRYLTNNQQTVVDTPGQKP